MHSFFSVRVVILTVLCMAMSGSRLETRAAGGTGDPSARKNLPPYAHLYNQGLRLIQERQYQQAIALLEQSAAGAAQAKDARLEALSAAGRASAYLFLPDNRKALQSFLRVRRLAQDNRLRDIEALADANISLVYGRMGALQEAGASLRKLLDGQLNQSSEARVALLLNLGLTEMGLGNYAEAGRIYARAAAVADASGHRALLARTLDRWGDLGLLEGDVAKAEQLLLEAYRVRLSLGPGKLHESIPFLGLLRAAQNRPAEALPLLNRALSAAERSDLPVQTLLRVRAECEMATGQPDRALDSLRLALRSIRQQRTATVPSTVLRARWEANDDAVRRTFLRLVTAREGAIGADVASETLRVVEESRQAALETSSGTGSADYFDKIAQRERAEAEYLAHPTPAAASALQFLDRELTNLELGSALDRRAARTAPLANPIELTQAGSAVFRFHLDEPYSLRWEISSAGLRLTRLAGRAAILDLAAAFRRDVIGGKSYSSAGKELYTKLFGEISSAARTAPYWQLVLDDGLFETPLSALTSPDGEFLMQRHAVEMALAVPTQIRRNRAEGSRFVGVADPIYNGADGRLPRRLKAELPLPRLVSSVTEVARGAQAARLEPTLLAGNDATRTALRQALSQPAAVLHFATHVVRSRADENRALIALSLDDQQGRAALLGSEEIEAWRPRVGLVVLSGCASGGGERIAGAGLMGLARSWLLAGADGVAASYWPTPDDTGEIFDAFYQRYAPSEPSSAALALREAQRAMAHSGTWRSAPRYWASFFVLTKG